MFAPTPATPGRTTATVRFDPMDSTDPDKADFGAIDFDEAADIFVSIFPGAGLAEAYDRAVSAAANCDAMGFDHEARVLRETALRIKQRLAH